MIIINNKFFFNKNQIKYIPLLNTTYNLNKIKNNKNNLTNLNNKNNLTNLNNKNNLTNLNNKNNLTNLNNIDLNISLFNDYELNIFYEFINYINKIKLKHNLENLNEKEIKLLKNYLIEKKKNKNYFNDLIILIKLINFFKMDLFFNELKIIFIKNFFSLSENSIQFNLIN
jgi:hypothetical protein